MFTPDYNKLRKEWQEELEMTKEPEVMQLYAEKKEPIFAAINAYDDMNRNSKLNIRVGTADELLADKVTSVSEQYKNLFNDFAKRSKPGDMALIDSILYMRKADD